MAKILDSDEVVHFSIYLYINNMSPAKAADEQVIRRSLCLDVHHNDMSALFVSNATLVTCLSCLAHGWASSYGPGD